MFDARTIKLLQPGQHTTSPDYPGLRLEVYSDRRTWTYRYRSSIDSALRQVKIGQWPAVSIHAAIAEWEKLRRSRDEGKDPALEARAERAEKKRLVAEKKVAAKAKSFTVLDAALEYWEGHVAATRAKKGVTEVRRMFDKDLGETGQIPAVELTRAQAFDLIKRTSERAPVQAGRLRTELGAAWDYCIDGGRLPDTTPNWWRLILRGKIKSKGKKIAGERAGTAQRVLSAEEVGILIPWLPNFTHLVEDVLTLYLWTVTRGAEIVAMEGCEVRFEEDGNWWWTIPKPKTKNARIEAATDLRVPLFGRGLAVVLRRKERYGEGFLFPARTRDGRVTSVDQKTIQTAVWTHQPYSETQPEHIRPRLPVTRWAPHDLRRTSRTLLAAMGCPGEVGESILGHMLPGVEGVYNKHAYDKERAEWLKRLSARLESLATP